jgi:hypothetical protein
MDHGGTSTMRFVADAISGIFDFINGVVSNARTFHPNGRIGTSLKTSLPDAQKRAVIAYLKTV